MGMKHEAKKGTVIEANGVKMTVLRGCPLVEVTADPKIVIIIRPKPNDRLNQATTGRERRSL